MSEEINIIDSRDLQEELNRLNLFKSDWENANSESEGHRTFEEACPVENSQLDELQSLKNRCSHFWDDGITFIKKEDIDKYLKSGEHDLDNNVKASDFTEVTYNDETYLFYEH